jgi:lysophospholipid acyltransferase (LPLAT)-like uncharacterized protein
VKRFLYGFVLPALICPIYVMLRFTWRIREHGPENVLQEYVAKRKPIIFVHWHGDELALVGYYAFRGLGILSSLSADGTLMAHTLTLLGYKVFRGSSTRGGARGLLGLIKAARAGVQTALAVDGPKGPIYQVKAGIVGLAERADLPVVAVRTSADRAWIFSKAWNKSYLPKPFARVDVYYGSPLILGKEPVEEKCRAIKESLDALTALRGVYH